jgi:hypothetical protein
LQALIEEREKVILEGGKLKAEQEKVSNFVCHVYNTELNGLSSHQYPVKSNARKKYQRRGQTEDRARKSK